MNNLQLEMHRIMQTFVEEIAGIARNAAVESLQSAFGRGKARAKPADVGSSLGRPRGVRGPRRTARDLTATSLRFVAFVQQHPGLRIEQINKQLGTETRDLALPIRRLIEQKVIRAQGQKRARTYFSAESTPN